MEERFSRRMFLKKGMVALGTLASFSALTGFYSLFLERYWIQTQRLKLSFHRLHPAFSGMKIVQFSDTHLGRDYSMERLQHVARLVHRQNPDMICFTGDLFDAENGWLDDRIVPVMSGLRAELGKFAVLGNHDLRLDPDRVRAILEKSGFQVLVNESLTVHKEKGSMRVAGLDEMMFGKPDLRRTLLGVEEEEFVLMLAHEPDFADSTRLSQHVDLQLSGHSHGGQIRIPFYGSLFVPDGGRKYSLGLYTFPNTDFRVYTNRGIGTTYLPIRFHCRPEITVFELERA